MCWTAGSQPSSKAEKSMQLPFPSNSRGATRTDETLRVIGHPRVFALGDIAGSSQQGQDLASLPATAQVAACAIAVLLYAASMLISRAGWLADNLVCWVQPGCIPASGLCGMESLGCNQQQAAAAFQIPAPGGHDVARSARSCCWIGCFCKCESTLCSRLLSKFREVERCRHAALLFAA